MNAIGQNIGIEQSVMEDIDLDMLIKVNIFCNGIIKLMLECKARVY